MSTQDDTTIPYGYCHCGCGQKTSIRTRVINGLNTYEPCKHVQGHEPRFDPLTSYWSKVNKTTNADECWEWTASKQRGYGRMRWNGRKELAHRIAWMLAYGDIPDDLLVCHKCDNPSCCNPSHLFLGTSQDNNRDKAEKGRAAKGERFGAAKLSDAQVSEIRERYSQGGVTQRQLAKEYGICNTYVSDLIGRKFRK